MTMCGRHVHPQTDPKAARMEECYMCRLERAMAQFMPREPGYRYFSHAGWWYCWTTEKMGDGKYAAFIYKPVGKGARSGKAEAMRMVKEIHFAKRSTAKARAWKWYQTAKAKAA
jgi:hypothetical protein